MSTEAKRKQVVDQCRAVAHLAQALADLHTDKVQILSGGHADTTLDIVGDYTAAFMEKLGDMLNGIDAASDEDEWLTPIFEEAQRLWPQKQEGLVVRGEQDNAASSRANTPLPAPDGSSAAGSAPFTGRQSLPAALQDWLADIEEYLRDRHDIRDGVPGGMHPLPNDEMALSSALKCALGEKP